MLYISGLKTLLARCSWLFRHPHLQRDAAEFLALPHTQTGERKAVRLLQGEVARFGLSKDNMIVGSDQATTCIIAIFVCHRTKTAVAAHIDRQFMENWPDTLLEGLEHPEVYLVGGYCESKAEGLQLCDSLLTKLQASPLLMSLALFCVGSLNTGEQGQPLATALAYDTASKKVLNAHFSDPGPALHQRNYNVWHTGLRHYQSIYDAAHDMIHSDSTHVQIRPDVIEQMLAMSDEELLRSISTSPEQEEPQWLQGTREFLQWELESNGQVLEAEKYVWSPDRRRWIAIDEL